MLRIDENLCTGCGDCIKVCPFDALSLKNGKAIVMNNACRLCGICMNACNFGAMAMADENQLIPESSNSRSLPNMGPQSMPINDMQQSPGFPGFGSGRGMGRGMGRGQGNGMGRGMGGGKGRGMGGGRNR